MEDRIEVLTEAANEAAAAALKVLALEDPAQIERVHVRLTDLVFNALAALEQGDRPCGYCGGMHNEADCPNHS